jgi:hypothetical protein
MMPRLLLALIAMTGLVILTGSAPAALSAQTSPERLARVVGGTAVPSGLGVNVHFTADHAQELRAIAEFGFRIVRTDLLWAQVERQPGRYDWARYEAFVADAQAAGLTPLLILAYSNPLYAASIAGENSPSRAFAPPRDGDARAAFMRFAVAAAARFGADVIWEIWNEPDLNFGSPVDLDAYVGFAIEACHSVRGASPNAPVIGPAASGFAWRLLNRFLAADRDACFDAVSVHPYRDRAPDDVLADWSRLGRMACDARPGCLPRVSSEWGYSSWGGAWTQDRQADNVARLYLLNLLSGVPVTIVYDWQDDADLPGEKEANFGLLTKAGAPKPVYRALHGLLDGLRGLTLIGRVAPAGRHTMVLAFGRNGRPAALVGWSQLGPQAITIQAAARIEPCEACATTALQLQAPLSMRLTSRPTVTKVQ